jgi:hypothetical protein
MLITGFPSPAAHHSGASGRRRPIGAQAPNAGKPRAAARSRARAWPALLLALAWALLAGCHREPPEQALRSTIAKMQAAAEAHDNDALFEPIADDFTGSEGMDRTAFRRYVTFMGMRHKSVGASLGPMDVKLFGDRATVKFTAALTGGAGLLPQQAQVYDVDTAWRLEGADWKLISARWKAAL